MSEQTQPEAAAAGVTPDEITSALFAQLVIQQSSMAAMMPPCTTPGYPWYWGETVQLAVTSPGATR